MLFYFIVVQIRAFALLHQHRIGRTLVLTKEQLYRSIPNGIGLPVAPGEALPTAALLRYLVLGFGRQIIRPESTWGYMS